LKIAAILPHVEVFGRVRRYIEIGNNFIKRGHSFTIYHPDGSRPTWLEFFGETRPIEQVILEENDIAISSEYSVLHYLERANADKKFSIAPVSIEIIEKHVPTGNSSLWETLPEYVK
jgi:hypothetical protein